MLESLHVGARVQQARIESRLFGGNKSVRLADRYRIVEQLGFGAMGVVFEAADERLERRVALKLIRQERLGPNARARFAREAEAMAQVTHPNVVSVFDRSAHEQQLFIAMELVDGPDLATWLEHNRPPTAQVREMFVRIGQGLAAAHRAGVIHRDFKPQNVLVAKGAVPKVADFGLSNMLAAETLSEGVMQADSRPSSQRLTGTREIVGTPVYAAPEVLAGERGDARSDQFSFFAALFEALVGAPPFRGDTLDALRSAAERGVRWPSDATVPGPLRRVVERGLCPQPEGRFGSMDAACDALESSVRRTWPRLVLVGLPVGVLAAGVAQTDDAPRPCDPQQALGDTWGDAARARLRASLTSLQRPAIDETAPRIEQALDAWAADWSKDYVRVCEGADDHEARRDHGMACLSGARGELTQTVELLTEADVDVDVAARGLELVGALPATSSCGTVSDEEPLRDDASLRRAVVAARSDLGRAAALVRSGRSADARTIATDVLDRARALRYAPLTTEAHLELGSALYELAELPEARGHLEQAYADAASEDRVMLAANVASTLAWVVVEQRDLEAALSWARSSVALAQRGDDDATLAAALSARAEVERRSGDPGSALASLREAQAPAERAHGTPSREVAVLAMNIGAAHMKLGEFETAQRSYEAALDMHGLAVGEAHPQRGRTLVMLSYNAIQRLQWDRALSYATRALDVVEAGLGAEHPRTADVLVARGYALCRLGRTDEGGADLERAKGVYVETKGPGSVKELEVQSALGGCALAASDFEGAARAYRTGLAAAERNPHKTLSQMGMLNTNLGIALVRMGDYGRAAAVFEDAAEINTRVNGPDHPVVAKARGNASVAYHHLGDFERAAEHAAAALAIQLAHHDEVSQAVRNARLNAGRAALALGRLGEAEGHFTAGLAIGEQLTSPTDPSLIKELCNLGEVDVARGAWETALAFADRALAVDPEGVFGLHRARARFVRARALGSTSKTRRRARSEAAAAAALLATLDDPEAPALRQRVADWLAEPGR